MSRLWTRFGTHILIAVELVVNTLAVVVITALVPKDGNLPRGMVFMTFWAVQLAVVSTISFRMANLSTPAKSATDSGDSRSASPVRDAFAAFTMALKGWRPGPYAVFLLVVVAFVVFAVLAPPAWFDLPWLSGVRFVFVAVMFLWFVVMANRGFDHSRPGPKPVFASQAERKRHLWQQVWPYGLVAAMVAGLVLGIVLIIWLVPVVGVGGKDVVAASALWTVVWGVVFWFVIAWLEKGSAGPKSRFRSATEPRRHHWQRRGMPRGPVPPTAERAKIMRAPSPAPRVERAAAWRAIPPGRDGGCVLTWDDCRRRRVVRTSARLHAEVLRLHLSTVTLPRSADFTPEGGVTVRISLGEERTVLQVDPADRSQSKVVTMEGLTSVGVAADGGRSYPPEAWLPMGLAMEVLRRYCATGELPGVSGDEAVSRPSGQEPAAREG